MLPVGGAMIVIQYWFVLQICSGWESYQACDIWGRLDNFRQLPVQWRNIESRCAARATPFNGNS